MSVGFVLLVHTALDRAAQVANHIARAGHPVVIHVDQEVATAEVERLHSILRLHKSVRFAPRYHCEWGTWSIVAATQTATKLLLDEFPDVGHVYLASGSCMPLQSLGALNRFLGDHPDTDFIESVATRDMRWTHGGLDQERLTLYHPVAWKRRRWLFDRLVALQRLFRIRRRLPQGLRAHLGSQWWCLSRKTLTAILNHPRREEFDRFFKTTWIPDESYFQTMVRLVSDKIEAQSLTLSKFDYQGRPYTFYDDHLELLRRSDRFFARKIWPEADRLYQNFLSNGRGAARMAAPDPAKIDQTFAKAVDDRTHGTHGLVMQSRFPMIKEHRNKTAAGYSVFQGFERIFDDFEDWLARTAKTTVHGRIFHPERAEFAGGVPQITGGLTSNAYLRDYDRASFLRNFIWNTREARQFFMYGPEDGPKAWELIAQDPNAQISVVTGAWVITLLHEGLSGDALRVKAAALQQAELEQLAILKGPETRATVRVLRLADYLRNPMEPLQEILDEAVAPAHSYLGEAPQMARLAGIEALLTDLRNGGLPIDLAGQLTDPLAATLPADTQAKAVQ